MKLKRNHNGLILSAMCLLSVGTIYWMALVTLAGEQASAIASATAFVMAVASAIMHFRV